ncbi:MAG: hypothetical protein Q8R37_05330 [Nanoarchaeota archaeon]|nr:hypothetical protein [Nanoarchaeota archaeon]
MVDPNNEKKNQLPVTPKKKRPLVIGVVVVSLFLIIILAKPSIVGFGVYEDDQNVTANLLKEPVETIEDVRLQLAGARQNLSLYQQLSEQYKEDLDQKSTALTEAVATKTALESTQSNFETTISLLESTLAEKVKTLEGSAATILKLTQEKTDEVAKITEELDSLTEDYTLLVENSAKNICCKQRVDNPQINSYDITNNKVICLEDGEKMLGCV